MKDKIRALEKLKSAGITDENKLKNLKLETLINVPGITIQDIKIITEIKHNTKNLYNYLLKEEERSKYEPDDEQGYGNDYQ